MAALGKILRKGAGTDSVHRTTQYERLTQDPSDNEEEEDDILFLQEGRSSRQNGFSHGKSPASNGKAAADHDNNIELSELGIQKARIRPASEVEVRVMKQGGMTRTRVACFIATMIMVVCVVIGLVVLLPQYRRMTVSRGHYNQTADWNVTYQEYGTESLVRLFDCDEDGRLDIIMSVVPVKDNGVNDMTRENGDKLCKEKGFLSYPCVSIVRALRGHDHALLWEFYAHSSIFEINCGNIDINKDGKMDCIASGRLTSIAAFDPRNGDVFWLGDDSVLEQLWNIYNVLVLVDFNKDGVPEILIAHGGDPNFPPSVTKRFSGRLILLDGATGNVLPKSRYLSMPDSKETYMSPVLHTRADGSQYILFGHGGETVPGTLFAISLPDFYRYAMNLKLDDPVPNTVGEYKDWAAKPKTDIGLIEIYRSQKKGVMVPPVLVDMDGDGVKDIVLSAYDGQIMLYDGETLAQTWSRSFADMESYSSPAPGYFNDDDVLDFMISENMGSWPHYNSTKKLILDGATGKTLWSADATMFDMTSDLVARTTDHNRDMFIMHMPVQNMPSGNHVHMKRSLHAKVVSGRQKRTSDTDFLPHQRKAGPRYPRPTPPPYHRQGWPQPRPQAPHGYQDDQLSDGRSHYMPNAGYPWYNVMDPELNEEAAEARNGGGFIDGDYANGEYPVDDSPNYDGMAPSRGSSRREYYGMDDDSDQETQQEQPSQVHEDLHEDHKDDHKDDHEDDHKDDHEDDHESVHETDYEDDEDNDDDIMPSCAKDPKIYITDVYLMDRSTAQAPLLIYRYQPVKIYSNFTVRERMALKLAAQAVPEENTHRQGRRDTGGDRHRQKRHGGEHAPIQKPMAGWSNRACTLMAIQNRVTGALGDVDGDGTLDLVLVLDIGGAVVDAESNFYIREAAQAVILKINLETVMKHSKDGGKFVDLGAQIPSALTSSRNEKKMWELDFKSYPWQPWTAYLGKHGNSVYDDSHGSSS